MTGRSPVATQKNETAKELKIESPMATIKKHNAGVPGTLDLPATAMYHSGPAGD
jgi:hypothetical protein